MPLALLDLASALGGGAWRGLQKRLPPGASYTLGPWRL